MPTVRFYNQIVGEAVDHLLYDFGDGTSSTSMASTVDHYYTIGGDYTTSLSAMSVSDQSSSKVKVIPV